MRAITQLIKKRKILLGVIILLLAGVIYWYTQSSKSSQQAVQYQTATAEKDTLIVAITGSGKISTANSTSITTDIGGIVEEVYVKSGDYVQAGTPLAKIKLDADSQQRQSESYASYLNAVNQATQSRISKASAQNTLEAARQSVLEAAQDVAELDEDLATDYINPATKNRYTQNEIDVIRSKLTQARSNFTIAEQKYNASDTSIAAANASLIASKLDYQNMTNIITAPVAGTLSNFTIQTGDTITVTTNSSTTSNSSVTPQKVATLNTSNKPSIIVNLSEIDIPKVKVGNKVTITVDAFPDKSFTGKVSDIDTTGTDSSGVVSYPVTIITDTPNDQLYANMSVTANIITSTKANVLLVPTSAVQKLNDQSTVRIMKNGQIETASVETGESSDTQIEITSGLVEGDQVVTSSTSSPATAQSSGANSVFSTGGFGGGLGGTRNVRFQTR